GVVEDDVRWPAAFAHVVYRTVAACTRPAVVCALAISFRAEGGMRNGGLFSVGGALILHSAGVDVQRPGAMLQHIRRDRARQRLTGNDDRLERGFQRGAPALPALGVVGGWGGDVDHAAIARRPIGHVAAVHVQYPTTLGRGRSCVAAADDL